MNRILMFSGGLSSFAVAHHLKTEYPNDNIVLYFTDTLWEDEDLYRFIDEVSDKLELPLLKHSMGIDPVQLMIKQKIIYNSRMGNCSTILKMRTSANYIKRGKVPKVEKWYNKKYLKDYNFRKEAVLYFGISFDEFHRTKAISENWKPFEVEFPLTKMYFDYDELLKKYNIKKPNLYLKGFTHNNCKGRCVKAGKKHFKLLYNEDNKSFNEMNEIEKLLGLYCDAWHSNKDDESKMNDLLDNEQEMYKWHSSNYQYKPTLKWTNESSIKPSIIKGVYLQDIKNEMDNNCQIDLFEEYGGCGCFVDYENFNEKEELDLNIKLF